jgi:hypothetical protein
MPLILDLLKKQLSSMHFAPSCCSREPARVFGVFRGPQREDLTRRWPVLTIIGLSPCRC